MLPGYIQTSPNWKQIFKNDNPLELELGFGRPHFLFERATSYKERNIIGIEWKQTWVAQANRRILRENITNVCAIHGHAWILMPTLFEEQSLSSIFINFPDPWWKKKHHKRRLLHASFINYLEKALKDKGTILLQTDVYEIFELYFESLKSHPIFQVYKKFKKNISKASSHREKKCEQNNVPIYRVLFTKNQLAN